MAQESDMGIGFFPYFQASGAMNPLISEKATTPLQAQQTEKPKPRSAVQISVWLAPCHLLEVSRGSMNLGCSRMCSSYIQERVPALVSAAMASAKSRPCPEPERMAS
ncbi:hypothetical protein AAFF_G00128770 [Aldrovandia affinis]|uniref:Uncharacterized protein n=1 Tax=Aldrovandia affinis TaxID=143900 RepID=A0AAD7WWU7_9TELE|nr:hypothetical protein AAFF_G00128770 [Aldrovandia affinis]